MTAAPMLEHGEIELIGRLREASNQTYAVRILDGETPLSAVYKPVSGEAPLWDFPDGTLALREYAAFMVSEALHWRIVPPTVLRDGPVGPGMVQKWIDTDAVEPVRVVPRGAEGDLLHVLDAEDQWGRPVSLVHEDTPALRRIAVFDLLVNNTDRKGSHVLPQGEHRYGIDHGVCFHSDDKVRTVLWGWAGTTLTEQEREGIEGLMGDHALHDRLRDLLAEDEVSALDRRCRRLLTAGEMPMPRGDWPPIPWPPL